MSHNLNINEDFHNSFPEWEKSIETEIQVYKRWHKYWIDKAARDEMPIYFIRFEDLLQNPKKILHEVFGFLL